jgi:hypothetical protein
LDPAYVQAVKSFHGISSVPVPTAAVHCGRSLQIFTPVFSGAQVDNTKQLQLLTDSTGEVSVARAHWLTEQGMASVPLKLGHNITQAVELIDFRGNLSLELGVPAAPLTTSYFLFHVLHQ